MPVDIFLSIQGIPGRSTDRQFPNQFEVASFSYALARPATAGGTAASKASFGPITVTLSEERAPLFLKALASGQNLQKLIFSFRKVGGDGTGFVFETVTLGLAFLTQMQSSLTDGDETPMLELTFVYGQIDIKEYDPKGDGGDNPDLGGWDVVKNIPR